MGLSNGANMAKGMIGEMDPPLPGALFSGGPTTPLEPTIAVGQVNQATNQVGGTVTADLKHPLYSYGRGDQPQLQQQPDDTMALYHAQRR